MFPSTSVDMFPITIGVECVGVKEKIKKQSSKKSKRLTRFFIGLL